MGKRALGLLGVVPTAQCWHLKNMCQENGKVSRAHGLAGERVELPLGEKRTESRTWMVGRALPNEAISAKFSSIT